MIQLSPFTELNEIHRGLSRVFDNRNLYTQEEISHGQSRCLPQVDIRETETEFTVWADLPGVTPEAVEVTLHDGTLTIKGERSCEKTTAKDGYKRRERIHGSFFRQFTLPESTNATAIKAKSVNGVVVITIPKEAKSKPLSITVEGD